MSRKKCSSDQAPPAVSETWGSCFPALCPTSKTLLAENPTCVERPTPEFVTQASLVDRLQQPWPQGLVNLESRVYNLASGAFGLLRNWLKRLPHSAYPFVPLWFTLGR